MTESKILYLNVKRLFVLVLMCVCLFLFYQHKINHIDSRTPHKCEGSLGGYTSQLIKNLQLQRTKYTYYSSYLVGFGRVFWGNICIPSDISCSEQQILSFFLCLASSLKMIRILLNFQFFSITSSQSSSFTSISIVIQKNASFTLEYR